MSAGVRITKLRLSGKKIKAKLRDIEHPDFEKQVEFIDENDDDLDEEWVFGVTDELTAELVRSTEVDDLLGDHEPPQWVQEGLKTWDIRVQE